MSASVEVPDELLGKLLNILGDGDGDLVFLLPLFESDPGAGDDIQDLSSVGLHGANVNALTYAPYIRGSLLSYRLDGTTDSLDIADNVLLSSIAGGVDVAGSWGCAFNMRTANAALKYLIAKWDDQTPNVEWRLFVDAAEKINFGVMDDSVAVSDKTRLYNTVLPVDTWFVVVATYDGQGGATPEAGINLYLWDGATKSYLGAVDDTTLDGGGVYVDMEDTAQHVSIGAADTAAGPVPATWFGGDIALPFMTRRQLSAGEAEKAVLTIVELLGL